jgi:hypothetical protein
MPGAKETRARRVMSASCGKRMPKQEKRESIYLCRPLIICQFPLVCPAGRPFPRSRSWDPPRAAPIVLRLASRNGGYASARNGTTTVLVIVPSPLCTGTLVGGSSSRRRGRVIEHEDLLAVLVLGRVRHHVAVPSPSVVGDGSVGSVMGVVVGLLVVRVRLGRGASEGCGRHDGRRLERREMLRRSGFCSQDLDVFEERPPSEGERGAGGAVAGTGREQRKGRRMGRARPEEPNALTAAEDNVPFKARTH